MADAQPRQCAQLKPFCKHGHPKTEETTFARKVKIRGRTYIVRECRECHRNRYRKTPAN